MAIDQQVWDELVLQLPGASFLQSWGWGELQRELGNSFWRVQEKDGVALVIKRPLRLGKNWLYIPRGPLAASPDTQESILSQALALAEQEKSVFCRSEPAKPFNAPWRQGRPVQPMYTSVVDLTHTAEELLAAMHQKTRYNIRLAQRRGVKVRFSRESADVEEMIRLMDDVQARAAFQFHPPDYYRTMLRVLHNYGVELAVAAHDSEVLAVHLLLRFGTVTTYVHGASSSRKRSLMAPYLLQWESIVRAQEAGSTRYDFYGIAPPGTGETHPWAGVTRFKKGFGGESLSYPGSFDLVLARQWYALYQLLHARR